MKFIEASIVYKDEPNRQIDGVLFAVGIDWEEYEDDDNVFFYLSDEKEIKHFKEFGNHDFKVIDYEHIS